MPDNLIPAYQVYRLSIREPLLLMVVLLHSRLQHLSCHLPRLRKSR